MDTSTIVTVTAALCSIPVVAIAAWWATRHSCIFRDADKVNVSMWTCKYLQVPSYQTSGSSGMDIPCAEDFSLQPGERRIVGTGITLSGMPRWMEAQIRPRSGLAAKYGVTVLNSPGTIDSDYSQEIKVILINHGKEPFTAQTGTRIAQIVFAPIIRLDTNNPHCGQRIGGFGSTGA